MMKKVQKALALSPAAVAISLAVSPAKAVLPCKSAVDITIRSVPFMVTKGAPPESPFVPSGYIKTFEDTFSSLGTISIAPIVYFSNINWYNGIEQCCISPYPRGVGSMFPTLVYGTTRYKPYALDPSGGLDIIAEKFTGSLGDWWASGVMQSVGTNFKGFSQQYGYFEIAAQFPSTTGTWPAFWMLPLDGPANPYHSANPNHGEIDIFEGYTQYRNGICTTLHDWQNDANSKQYCFNKPASFPDVTAAYHIYGFLWTSTTASVFFDGQKLCEWATLANMNAPYYLLVDLGIGGGGQVTTNTKSPATMKVRYIRAYKAP